MGQKALRRAKLKIIDLPVSPSLFVEGSTISYLCQVVLSSVLFDVTIKTLLKNSIFTLIHIDTNKPIITSFFINKHDCCFHLKREIKL